MRLGFASVWVEDNFLHHLFVSQEVQSHGVRSALLALVQQEFTATGSVKCLLENKQALAFYQRHGWHTVAHGDSPDGPYCLMHYPLPSSR